MVSLILPHSVGQCQAFPLREVGRVPGGQAVQGPDDMVDLPGVLFREGGHDELRLPPPVLGQDIAVLLEPVEGASYRGPAHAEVLRQLALHDPRSRGHGSFQDHLPDLVIRGVVQVAVGSVLFVAVHSGYTGRFEFGAALLRIGERCLAPADGSVGEDMHQLNEGLRHMHNNVFYIVYYTERKGCVVSLPHWRVPA